MTELNEQQKKQYIEPVKIRGLCGELDQWKYKSCTAECGIGDDWATVYFIKSEEQGKGHATNLLLIMKGYYEKKGLRFGSSVALSDRMRRIFQNCGVKEYTQIDTLEPSKG